ncbi:LysR family transcriptional regulator [Corallococcus terminator]|uniref:LysR family transcriptional regulator n=2 Tax=Corallococcus terminator TaxID=2316733 RepID=A0A3A8JLE2_9BACT|nr:LysR family transcriptional regulator [Corallococcus terminator]
MHGHMRRIHETRKWDPDEVDLAGINLNLLVALDALLKEAHVTRAAARVGLTQSAMSHALGQLRELLDDALLIRGRGGMVLTPRAEQLAAPLRRGLVELQRALRNEPAFEPATASRRFTVATRDYFGSALLPSALELLGREAPGVDLTVLHVENTTYPALLESGEVDLVVVTPPVETGPGLRQQKLFTEDFVCVVRKGHPRVRKTLDLDTYVKLSHVLISPRGDGVGAVDRVLAQRGLPPRRIALRVPYFLIAPLVVTRSDHVLTAPRRLIAAFSQAYPLQVFAPPLPVPSFDMIQVWHERFDGDPAHQWLRGFVARAVGASHPGSRNTRSSRRVRRTPGS